MISIPILTSVVVISGTDNRNAKTINKIEKQKFESILSRSIYAKLTYIWVGSGLRTEKLKFYAKCTDCVSLAASNMFCLIVCTVNSFIFLNFDNYYFVVWCKYSIVVQKFVCRISLSVSSSLKVMYSDQFTLGIPCIH